LIDQFAERPAARREVFEDWDRKLVVSEQVPIITMGEWMGPSDVRESAVNTRE
jgi:hypothetical protein